jgi:ATP-dependent DNA helicase UvrD/PcrA
MTEPFGDSRSVRIASPQMALQRMIERMFDLDTLNAEQRAAVIHPSGPVVVVAGAGTGKTRTLVARVAWLVESGVRPDRILLLTFTRRAAREMLRRADRLLGGTVGRTVWGGTFHGTAHRLLRRHGGAVGLPGSFTILDKADVEGLFGLVRGETDVDPLDKRFPSKETIAAIYTRVVNAQERLEAVLDERFPWCAEHADALAEIFTTYTEKKRAHGTVDYDDLLLYWRELLRSPAGTSVAAMFDHVLVDEYQDTNAVQADILGLLCGPGGNLTVVGDDAQAIYGFRAASCGNLLAFADRFPGAATVRLEENYRSTPQILAAANHVMEPATGVVGKTLWTRRPAGPLPDLVTCVDESAQADFVCDRILARRENGVALRDQAVLFRTGHHPAVLELELARRDIPYVKFGGLRFLETSHVKDVVALLRIVENETDEMAWHRVLTLVPGVGQVTAAKILGRISLASSRAVAAFCDIDLPLPSEGRSAFEALQAGLAAAAATRSPSVRIEALRLFYELVFERRYDDVTVRLADIATLAAMASAHESTASFLADLALDPPVSTSDLAGPPHLDDDYLVLSTIHSAKGCEWSAVHVIHASDGNIPSDMALGEPGGLEEERRLMYVAMTRAKDQLVVSLPQRYHHRRFGADAAYSYAPRSRFLEGAEALFAAAVTGVATESDARVDDPAALDPVRDVLASLWG